MTNRTRYEFLDILRGITLISMVLYHAVWDLVYIVGVDWDWFRTEAAYIWQQSICWTFILLAGFCRSFGRKKWKRGLVVFSAGILITAVTMIFTPGQRVLFGVLTLLGSCMLLMIPLEKVLTKVSPVQGMVVSAVLFFVTRNINEGCLGFGKITILELPASWYDGGLFMTYLGVTKRGFFSTDYFSLIPWLFLFVTGYFLYRLATEKMWLEHRALQKIKNRPLAFIGRHSLLIYLLHQPVLYVLLCLGR